MTSPVPVPRRWVVRLLGPVVGGIFFLALAAAHGAATPGYDPWHQSVSALALAPHGWLQALNFFVLGAAVLSAVPAWRRVLAGGRGETWYPALAVVLGLGFLVLGCVPQDPAPGYDPAGLALDGPTPPGLLHLAVAGVAAAASVALLLVVASRLDGNPRWPGWARATRGVAALTAACVAVYGVWSTRESGLAGTFERLAVLAPTVWLAAFLGRLWTGRPFMAAAALDPPRARSGRRPHARPPRPRP